MKKPFRLFTFHEKTRYYITRNDLFVFIGIGFIIYACLYLARRTPAVVAGPTITLSPGMLPWYAALSLRRMSIAYMLTMFFTLFYGYLAASSRRCEKILIPLLDVLQSVPILSFLPVALLSLSAILPQKMAVELASIVLIFTSQVWHLTFAWYQSLNTIPKELREASRIFGFNGWLRFKTMELPFGAIGLIWNSMMSWAGGWFFLMAAEIFTVGNRDFRLPGLGAYLQEAANRGNISAILWGIGTLVLIIVSLDQFVWCPLLAWSDHFKLEMVGSGNPPSSWFYEILRNSNLIDWLHQKIFAPISEGMDIWLLTHIPPKDPPMKTKKGASWQIRLLNIMVIVMFLYGAFLVGRMLMTVSPSKWASIGIGLGATTFRVLASLIIALAWTIPVGVAIGTNPHIASWMQPLVQITASIPATALFPILLLILLNLPGGLNLAAILLMLMGTQWYLLFNVIAGAMVIPQDLKYTTSLLQLRFKERWGTLILPALFPYIITGAITASGGAWNASIIAEHVEFAGKTLYTKGIGTIIVQATATGDYPLLLAATLSMVLCVALINLLVWQRLYHIAEERYRME